MKVLEKIVGVNFSDLQVAIPAIKDIYTRLSKTYVEQTHPKLKILD